MTEVMPYIHKEEKKASADGVCQDIKVLIVQGNDLNEVKKIFEEEWTK
jgi:hydroxymethylpyrimidine pyrophosphatase-like HAD family hydrolase